MKTFEWAVIGGGIAGIAVSEVLVREGHSVILIEKNEKLAGVTTRDFHEWIHTGALYTLIPDKLITLKFILGAIDDLIEFYASFKRMNLYPTTNGLQLDGSDIGWFSENNIHFKYRIAGRKITFPWLLGVARSIDLINKISHHDWLRRRAGEIDPFKKNLLKGILNNFFSLLKYKEKYLDIKTTDFTTNSRILLKDIFSTAINNGLEISLGNKIQKIRKSKNSLIVEGQNELFSVNNIAICAGAGTGRFTQAKMKTSYAPIAVVNGINHDTNSFVELDYFTKNCINIITKGDGIGLIGGISLNHENKCDDYLNFVISEHKKINPGLQVIGRYIGKKNEIIFPGQKRNYLYHINPVENINNVWTIIPGKFTLAFSLAPEFYRRIYGRNPKKIFDTIIDDGKHTEVISNTFWYDIVNGLED